MTDREQEAARREAMALHLWDEGIVRPEPLAFTVVDEFIKEGWVAAHRPTVPDEDVREALDYAIRCALAPLNITYKPWFEMVEAVKREVFARFHVTPRGEQP